MANKDYVEAPHRIVDPDLERVVYGTGERVPLDDAVKYGLVSAADAKKVEESSEPAKKQPVKRAARARKASEDRARKPDEDR